MPFQSTEDIFHLIESILKTSTTTTRCLVNRLLIIVQTVRVKLMILRESLLVLGILVWMLLVVLEDIVSLIDFRSICQLRVQLHILSLI
jgi:hypothetical protein